MTNPAHLILSNRQAPGDVLMMTCAVRDLHKQYPHRYLTQCTGSAMDIWQNNPNAYAGVTPSYTGKSTPAEIIRLGYSSAIQQSNQRIGHFASGFVQDLSEKLGIRIRLTELRPDVYLTAAEKDPALRKIKVPYWIIVAGGKKDFTAKIWDFANYQTVANVLSKDIKLVQVGSKSHLHRPLSNVDTSLFGTTSLRDLMVLIYHSEGVICPVTCMMHFAAAFNKGCVCIAGGREPWWWEGYTRLNWTANCITPCPDDFVEHAYLHTIGRLDCCKNGGCWRNGVGEKKPAVHNCRQLIHGKSQVQPKCLGMITSELVIDSVRRYMNKQPVITPNEFSRLLKPQLWKEPLVCTRKIATTVMAPTRPAYQNPPRRTYGQKLRRHSRLIQRVHSVKDYRRITTSNLIQERNTAVVKVNTNVATPVPVRERGVVPVGIVKPTTNLLHIGKVTICVLLYGDHPILAKRCLQGIIATVRPELFELRIGLNEVSPATLEYVEQLKKKHSNIRTFKADKNICKYPMMTRMFNEQPITTKWLIWFDDDSWIVDSKWLSRLDQLIGCTGGDMYGRLYFWHYTEGEVRWAKAASWFRGKAFDTRRGLPIVKFMTGGFWAIKTETLKLLHWPDPRLINNGGDTALGEACHQSSLKLVECYFGIRINDGKRRGVSQKHPVL